MQSGKRFVLSLNYNESNSFLFIRGKSISIQSKKLRKKDYTLCLNNISKDF